MIPFRISRHQITRSLSFILLCTLLLSLAPVRTIQAQDTLQSPSEITVNGWVFSPVIKTGELGFSAINVGRLGAGGEVVIYGTRSGTTGLYKISSGVVTTIAVPGTVFTTTGGLSGTITTPFATGFDIDPEGRVVFTALAAGGGLPAPGAPGASKWPAFRWDNGSVVHMLPSGSAVAHNPTRMNNKGEWMAQSFAGEDGDSDVDLLLTNGEVITPLLSYSEDSDCPEKFIDDFGEVNARGQLLYYTSEEQGGCDMPYSANWALRLTQPLSSTEPSTATISIDSGNQTSGEESNGTNLPSNAYQLNDNGDVAYVLSTFVNEESDVVPTSQKLIVSDASGDVTLLDRAPYIVLHGLDNAKRVTFQILDNGASPYYAGSDLITDRIVGKGDTIAGETTTFVALHDLYEPAAATFGDKRVFLFAYGYGEDGFGFALASKGVTRWVNPAGGAWSTAANWLPAEVPGGSTETLFDLEASYDVNVGTRTSGRSSVENGSVLFADADLELQGPLSVGNDALLTLTSGVNAEGVIEAGELFIGHLPPIDPTDPPLAKLNLMNAGTVFTTTGITRIGDAGRGELFISGANMNSSSVEIGGALPGAATIGSPLTFWTMQSLAIGAQVTGTLEIERGASVRTLDQAIIGKGTTKEGYLASVIVDNGGSEFVGDFGNWSVGNLLSIGDDLRGELTIRNGGLVFALEEFEMGIVGRNDRQAFDATLLIQGIGDDQVTTSRLQIIGDSFISTAQGARSSIQVANGGDFSFFGLTLAEVENSIAYLMVDGVHSTGKRSIASGGTTTGNDSCDIGSGGRAQLSIRSGALFECYRVYIGVDEQSHGQVVVDGKAQGKVATLSAPQVLCVGGSVHCGTATGATGRLSLQNGGVVQTGDLVVGIGGVVVGTGQIAVNTTLIEGQLSPGVELVPGLEELEDDAQTATTHSTQAAHPGTLTVSGPVTLNNTSVITIDITNETAVDKLVIEGHAKLNGKLVLNFSNGYAPQQGDTFDFLQSLTSSGDFASVEVKGLQPGFTFEITTSNGITQLVANSDGVATTQPDPFNESLVIPFVSK